MPRVSVILPVYNAEKYLHQSIDSILRQTFGDLELLIINDGSSDSSENIIKSYKDPRINSIKNVENKGLIYSLNKAIRLAKGDFIARMDADDVAMPERLEKQLNYIEKANVDILAARVKLIDANGNFLPDWQDDIKNSTSTQIKDFLPKDNCIAHPTVIGRASLFKTYKYQYNQKYSEDYDLWLRILADGLIIEKIPEPLLFYRVLSTSETRFKKINIFFRLAQVKFRFVNGQVKKRRLTLFCFRVFIYACFDLIKALGKELKALFKS